MAYAMRYMAIGFVLASILGSLSWVPPLGRVWFIVVAGYTLGLLTFMLHFCVDKGLEKFAPWRQDDTSDPASMEENPYTPARPMAPADVLKNHRLKEYSCTQQQATPAQPPQR
ncbi:MAG: hypothetical protein JJD98_10335 [Polaromonas sp.]|nr:hypothetical protein [Polaromonas sp.]